MMKYLLLLLLAFLCSCATDTEPTESATSATDTTATATPAEDPALAALGEEDRNRLLEYGIDIYKGIPQGLRVGETAPIFKANDHTGKELFLPDLYKKQPVVMVFYRGVWCPACNQYLSALQDSLKYIKNAGAMLVAISPESVEKVKETVDSTDASFSVISDPNGYVMSAYGLSFHVTKEYQQMVNDKLGVDIATNNITEDAKLPVPATYIIGTDGKIKYVYFHPDYHQRATVKEIVEELKKLK